MKLEKLEEPARKRWTRVFVIAILCITVVSIGVMNIRYDSLARYPYKDERSREIIKEHLTDEEIAYIIEYSIPPNMFIAFIDEEGFNIYHAAEYKQLSNVLWQETPGNIVKMVEETRDIIDLNSLIYYLNIGYDYDSIYSFLQSDDYLEGDGLAVPINSDIIYLSDSRSMSTYEPSPLVSPVGITVTDSSITLKDTAEIALENVCSVIANEIQTDELCSSLVITKGYVSYEDQAELNESGESSIAPGHDDHQTGLAVNFTLIGLEEGEFYKTQQFYWLLEFGWQYGFVAEQVDHTMYFRYVGTDIASAIHDSGQSYSEFMEEYMQEWYGN